MSKQSTSQVTRDMVLGLIEGTSEIAGSIASSLVTFVLSIGLTILFFPFILRARKQDSERPEISAKALFGALSNVHQAEVPNDEVR